jgi:membrane associated rhomboid family serine protease
VSTNWRAAMASTWMNWLLVAANVGVFAIEVERPRVFAKWVLSADNLELWMFLSYAFLHISWSHLLCNMLALLVFGPNVNRRLGQVGYLGFYLGGAVASAVGFLIWGGQAMVGASGAVGAVMGAYLVLLPTLRLRVFLLVGTAEVSSLYFVAVFFLFNVVMMIVSSRGVEPVAYEAHVAGILFGALSMLGLLLIGAAPRESLNLPDLLLRRWRGVAEDTTALLSSRRHEERGMRIAALRARIAQALSGGAIAEAANHYLQLQEMDDRHFLPLQAQLNVASQLAADQRYPQAAAAYEQLLKHFPDFEQVEEVHLMLGLIQGRYLAQPGLAEEHLRTALQRLKGADKIQLANLELDRLHGQV